MVDYYFMTPHETDGGMKGHKIDISILSKMLNKKIKNAVLSPESKQGGRSANIFFLDVTFDNGAAQKLMVKQVNHTQSHIRVNVC